MINSIFKKITQRNLFIFSFFFALFVIILSSFVGYGHLCKQGMVLYSDYSDLLAQHLATKLILYRSVEAGHGLPFWREDQFSGNTALINLEAMYLHPLHFLFYIFAPLDALGPTLLINFILAALSFYMLGLALNLPFGARIVMSLAGMFNFKLIAVTYAGWISHTMILAALPLIPASTIYFFNKPGLKRCVLLAMTVGFCFTAGHIQYFYYALGCTAILVLLESWKLWQKEEKQQLKRVWAWLVIGAFLAVGLGAYMLIPLASEASYLSRATTSYSFFLGNHSLHFKHLLTFLYPEALGTPLSGTYSEMWEDVAYFGIVPLLLALFGAFRGWRQGKIAFLISGFVFCILMAVDTPVLRAFYHYVPGFQFFRLPNRFLFIAAFFGITLAGLGTSELLTTLKARSGKPLASLLALALLSGLVVGEGAYWAHRYLKTAPQKQVWPDKEYATAMKLEAGLFRVSPIGRSTLNYGWSAPLGLQLITGYGAFNYSHYWQYLDLLTDGKMASHGVRTWGDVNRIARWDLLDALNVKYIITNTPINAETDRLEQKAALTNRPNFLFYHGMINVNQYVYLNRRALPRAFLPLAVIGVGTMEEAVHVVRQNNLHDLAVIIGEKKGQTKFDVSDYDKAEITAYWGGHLKINSWCKKRRFLVISEVWHPGWKARLNDRQPLKVFRTNLAMIGVWVPEGKHQITVNYRPPFWTAGKTVSIASLLTCLLLCLSGFWPRSKTLT